MSHPQTQSILSVNLRIDRLERAIALAARTGRIAKQIELEKRLRALVQTRDALFEKARGK